MANWFKSLRGLVLPESGARDEAPAPLAPRVILGGANAPELCMLPVESWVRQPVGPSSAFIPAGRRVVQLKADGINAALLGPGIVGGREGGPLDCALHCLPGLRRIEEAMGCEMALFGEYVAAGGFNATLGEYQARQGDGVFWLYDALPYGAWVTGREYEVPIEKRLTSLRDAFRAAAPSLFVGLLDWRELDERETLAWAREAWAAGYEGLVSKEARSGYARRRDERWVKIKERFTAHCAVIDTVRTAKGSLVAIVKGPAAAGGTSTLRISGFTAGDAAAIEAGAANPSGRVLEIEFELTVSEPRTVRAATFKGIIA